jgi:hypothetical protein
MRRPYFHSSNGPRSPHSEFLKLEWLGKVPLSIMKRVPLSRITREQRRVFPSMANDSFRKQASQNPRKRFSRSH